MTKSQTTGIAAVFIAILAAVSWTTFRQASAGTGITVHQPELKSTGSTEPKAPTRSFSSATSGGEGLDVGARAPVEGAAVSTAGQIRLVTTPDPHAPSSGGSNDPNSSAPATVLEIVVQVEGAVKKPGVYHLRTDARNDDAIKAAGGLAGDANSASVNLAARAVDGSQLYVKTRKEQKLGGVDDMPAAPSLGTGVVSTTKPSPALHAHRTPGSANKGAGGKPAKLKSPSEGKININTAPAEELQRISGIGPSMAEKIIAYRQENQGFKSIDDLMQVSGIGAKKFEKMAPFVKLR